MPMRGKFKSKTPAIPLFYMIITDNQSTKLVYNLVYRKDRVSRFDFQAPGYWSRFCLKLGGLFTGVGAMVGRSAALGHRSSDGLAKLLDCVFISFNILNLKVGMVQ